MSVHPAFWVTTRKIIGMARETILTLMLWKMFYSKSFMPTNAGISCEMDSIMDIARRYGLKVIEDAAQGVMSTYKGQALGTIGDFGCYSFHETKNFSMGEGGALIVQNFSADKSISTRGLTLETATCLANSTPHIFVRNFLMSDKTKKMCSGENSDIIFL